MPKPWTPKQYPPERIHFYAASPKAEPVGDHFTGTDYRELIARGRWIKYGDELLNIAPGYSKNPVVRASEALHVQRYAAQQ